MGQGTFHYRVAVDGAVWRKAFNSLWLSFSPCVQVWCLIRRSSPPRTTAGWVWHANPWFLTTKSWKRSSNTARRSVCSTCHQLRRRLLTRARKGTLVRSFCILLMLELYFDDLHKQNHAQNCTNITQAKMDCCCKIACQAQENKLTPCLASTRRTGLCFLRSAGSISCPSVLRLSLRLRAWGPVPPCRPLCASWYPTSRGSSTTTTSCLKSIRSWLRTTLERKSSVFTSDRSGDHRAV